MAARVTRAKKKISGARIAYRVPAPAELPPQARLLPGRAVQREHERPRYRPQPLELAVAQPAEQAHVAGAIESLDNARCHPDVTRLTQNSHIG